MSVAIIVAAGSGTRVGGKTPKQFIVLAGDPLLVHTIKKFERSQTISRMVVLVPTGEESRFLAIASRYNLKKIERVLTGGPTRAETVWSGLQAVESGPAEIVAIHDGARPLVEPDDIDRTVLAAQASGAAILAARATDTIKQADGGIVSLTLNRRSLWHAQTPQCFRYDTLLRAYEDWRLHPTGFATDDSELVERLGVPVSIVESTSHNLKITTPEDFTLAEALLKKSRGG